MPTFPPTDADAYKALARAWAATVTVVTARHGPGAAAESAPELDGFTATAFLTVSINPPLVLVSVTNASSGLSLLREAEGFAVNLLLHSQTELAAAFARPQVERAALWNSLGWTPDQSGAPLLPGTAGAFSARPRQFVEAGDHTLVLGDVTAIYLGDAGEETLVYHNRGYGRVRRHE